MYDVIVDLDGTIFDIAHRRHYVASKPKNWKAFNSAMHLDVANEHVVWTVRSFFNNGGRILLASGREETFRAVSENKLGELGIIPIDIAEHAKDAILYNKFYMRAAKDNRPDTIVKSEILDQMRAEGFNPVIAIDDRQSVVDMWRARGLTCLQCAPGNF
jgi:hypothetical protein